MPRSARTTGARRPVGSVKSVTIAEPALLIRLNRSYREGMSDLALYEATRGVWRLGPQRQRAQIALACNRGIVLEVYSIHAWHPGDSTPYETRTFDDPRRHSRWEFSGSVAPDGLREKYVGKSVDGYLKRGARAPVMYVNFD